MELNKIYNCDCFELLNQLPNNYIDLIFIDPSYHLIGGGNSKKNGMRTKYSVCNNKGITFKEICFEKLLPLLYLKIKNNSYFFIMTNDRNLKKIWELSEKSNFIFCEILIMKKKNKVMSVYFAKQAEFILMFRKGKYKKLNKYNCNIIDVSLTKGNKKIHPSEKPESLLFPIIESCSKENDIIFDPCSGSGTTAIACEKTNRKYICCEIDKEYYNRSIKRLNDFKNNLFEKVAI